MATPAELRTRIDNLITSLEAELDPVLLTSSAIQPFKSEVSLKRWDGYSDGIKQLGYLCVYLTYIKDQIPDLTDQKIIDACEAFLNEFDLVRAQQGQYFMLLNGTKRVHDMLVFANRINASNYDISTYTLDAEPQSPLK